MTAPAPAGMTTVIPGPCDSSLDDLAEKGTTALAEAIRLYRARQRAGGELTGSFNSSISAR